MAVSLETSLFRVYRVLTVPEVTFMGVYMVLGH